MDYRYPTRFTLAGTTVIAAAGTAALIAAPAAGAKWRLGAINISVQHANSFIGRIQDGDGTELFTAKILNGTTIPISLPANGMLAPTAAKALQLVNDGSIGGTVGVVGFYVTEPARAT